MGDGHTRAMGSPGTAIADWFLSRNQARIVIVAGGAVGNEFELTSERIVLGRGPDDVDLAFDDDAMSRQHAALQIGEDGFEIRDLDSTNGVTLNGSPVRSGPLKHGDRFQLGDHVFRYLIEERERELRAFEIPES